MTTLLETQRLSLRQFTAADVDHLVALDGDPEVMRFLTGGRPTPRHRIKTEVLPRFLDYYRRHEGLGFWAADDRSTNSFLGWFELRPLDDDRPGEVELGYRLTRSAWGRGYATEGARALVAMAFTQLAVERVVATTMAVNTGSRRVMEKAGLSYVRTVHERWPDPIPGSEHGEVEYALTREQWLTRDLGQGAV